MVHWLAAAGSDPQAPLFRRVSAGKVTSQPMLKAMYIKRLRQLIHTVAPEDNPMHYAGHSLRIAAATFMAVLGVPRPVAKSVGGWISDCMDIYIHTSGSQKLAATLQIGNLFSR